MWEERGLVLPALLDAICSMAGCVATKDLSQVCEATVVVFHQCGRLLPCLSIGKTRTAQIQTGQKGAEVKCSRFYLQAGGVPSMSTRQQAGQTWHTVCSCSTSHRLPCVSRANRYLEISRDSLMNKTQQKQNKTQSQTVKRPS